MTSRIQSLAGPFPVVFLTGPRQSGKTTLCRAAFPDYRYISLEDIQNREAATVDPRGFLRQLESVKGTILDEAQHVPDLFSYIQGFVDDRRGGPLIMTGSQNFLLSQRITQSLAGRAAVVELLPFSIAELAQRQALTVEAFERGEAGHGTQAPLGLDEILFCGLFPAIHDRHLDPTIWLDSYLRTYIERDVRSLANVGDLAAFARFLALCAGRTGQLLNSSSLANDAGINHSTARRWLSILEASYVVTLLRPHFENFSKRLIRASKLYFVDTGLVCRLLGVRSPEDLRTHPLRGQIFENSIVTEFRKLYLHDVRRPPLYFWRDSNGMEVDLVVDLGTKRVPVEIKAGRTVNADYFKHLERYTKLSHDPYGIVVYGGDESGRRLDHLIRPWWNCT